MQLLDRYFAPIVLVATNCSLFFRRVSPNYVPITLVGYVYGMATDELSVSFKQAREMLKTGQLPTIKLLIERYIHKVIISGDNIEIQFNLNISSRVVTYSADLSQKEIPQPSGQEVTEVFSFVPTKMLATRWCRWLVTCANNHFRR